MFTMPPLLVKRYPLPPPPQRKRVLSPPWFSLVLRCILPYPFQYHLALLWAYPSSNVKGLNSNIKRRLLLTELRSASRILCFFRKNISIKGGNFSFARSNNLMADLASTNRKKSGLAILLAASCPLQVTSTYSDPNGRFIILQGTLHGVPLTRCNIYAPNTSQIRFLIVSYIHSLYRTPCGGNTPPPGYSRGLCA